MPTANSTAAGRKWKWRKRLRPASRISPCATWNWPESTANGATPSPWPGRLRVVCIDISRTDKEA